VGRLRKRCLLHLHNVAWWKLTADSQKHIAFTLPP